jgi:hypothetical protein
VYVSQEDSTALIWAAKNGHAQVVTALIENGADVEATEKVRHRFSGHEKKRHEKERMTKECVGPDCSILALQGVSLPCTFPVVLRAD